MKPLPADITDLELIAFVDEWASLLEREDYEAAYRFTDHRPVIKWSSDRIRDAIKYYGDADPNQRVTLHGVPTDITQRKEIERKAGNPNNYAGYIWYDLNIDGKASDLTATFDLHLRGNGMIVLLDDIHVM